jgi:5-methyltetrahydrofolate--homocysteine methyltransferase
MAIDFSPERWEKVKDSYRSWWAGKLSRPIVELVLTGRDPGRPQPKAPVLSQATCADLTIPAVDLIDRLDYELAKEVHLGDAFPMVSMDVFGPGIVAAFLGARLDNSTGSVWFHSPADIPIEDLHLHYDPENVWLRRIKEICAAAMDYWQGQVLVGMADLGGTLDILSTFRPSEKLPLDLLDSPNEVKRLVGEIHDLWYRFYTEIEATLQPVNPGYSVWCKIFSDQPFHIYQCDFSYMISPEMFREFARDELDASTRQLSRCFYHMDGQGQLPHLNMILGLERLNGVQWCPGVGEKMDAWIDVYRRIFAAGKKTQVFGDIGPVQNIIREAGLGSGIHYRMPGGPLAEEKRFRRELACFGFDA